MSKVSTLGKTLLFTALAIQPALADIVTFTPFTANSPLGGAPIGFAYVGDGFVGSIQKDGTGVLYKTDLNGGSIQPFAPAASLAASPSSEHYVTSSLGLGGFPNRDVYVAAGSSVVHISHDGTASNTFISGLIGDVRGILFDSVGTFANHMLITTDSGRVYEVTSSGVVTQIADTGEDTEGLDIAPTTGNLGIYNGSLLVASENSGLIRAISPLSGHAVTVIATVQSAEQLSVVPINLGSSGNPAEGMYGASYNINVVKAPASQFASLLGDIIVTGETTHVVTGVHYNGTTFVVTPLGSFPAQPEDGVFVTAAIVSAVPEPSSFLLLGSIAGIAILRLRATRARARRP